jgi:phospholipase/carboxylesterase
VLIVSGAQDPIVPADNAVRLADLLCGAGAAVEHRVLPVAHRLSTADIVLASRWMQTAFVDPGKVAVSATGS